jgi:hypothetical protein
MMESQKAQQAIVAIGWPVLLFYAFFVTSRANQFMAESWQKEVFCQEELSVCHLKHV